jgi:hypothetical protein
LALGVRLGEQLFQRLLAERLSYGATRPADTLSAIIILLTCPELCHWPARHREQHFQRLLAHQATYLPSISPIDSHAKQIFQQLLTQRMMHSASLLLPLLFFLFICLFFLLFLILRLCLPLLLFLEAVSLLISTEWQFRSKHSTDNNRILSLAASFSVGKSSAQTGGGCDPTINVQFFKLAP